jgi:DNA primase
MEIIDQIRQVANIVDIASRYTTLKRRGKKYVGLCPFHSEKDPSFTVDDEKQLFHCFGCGAGGDIFTLIMEKENLSFPEALRSLAQKYNIALPQQSKVSPQLRKLEEQLFKINEETLAFFKKNLFTTAEGEKAHDYLKKRGVSEKIIQELKIGYAFNSWDSLLSHFQAKGVSPKLLEKGGLVLFNQKKASYYDRFRGRVIFPIFDLTGKVVAFGGRTIFDDDPKYLNSPDTPVYSKGKILYGMNFCKESIRERGELILVEGYTDFISVYQAGIKNAAASLGTSLTSDQTLLALRFAPRMIVSYDGDSAGRSAAGRAVSLCFEKGLQAKVVLLPQDVDPDNFIRKYGADEYKSLILKSAPSLNFLIDSFLQEKKDDSPEEKARVARLVVREVAKIPDSITRSEYLKKVSEYLSIDEGALRRIIQQKFGEEKAEEKEPFLPAEKRLLQILYEDEDIAPYVFEEIKEEDIRDLKGKPIFIALSNCFKNGKKPSHHELKEKIDAILLSSLSRVLLEKEQPATVEEAFECINALRQFSLENRSKELKAEIIKSERNGEKEKLRALLSQRQEITRQLSSLSKRSYQNLGYNNETSSTKERS